MGMPEVVVEGEVVEADPPRKLVQTWSFQWDEIKDEGPTRVTFEIDEGDGGVSKLTVTHELENAPLTAAQVGRRDRGCGRRLAVRPQRPQDAARDRRVAAGLNLDERDDVAPVRVDGVEPLDHFAALLLALERQRCGVPRARA